MKKSILIRGLISNENTGGGKYRKNHITKIIDSIRNWYDGEIIICTWVGQELYLEGVKDRVDKIVYLDEPKYTPCVNIKKQVYSLSEGLKHCTGDIILETRADIAYNKNIFEEYIDLPYKDEKFRLFNNRILTCSTMTIDTNNFDKLLGTFRYSDWMHLGYRDDLIKFSDIMDIIDNHKLDDCDCPERFWILSLYKKHIADVCDYSDTKAINQNNIPLLLNNFIVKNTNTQLAMINFNWTHQPEDMGFYITFDKYMDTYNKY